MIISFHDEREFEYLSPGESLDYIYLSKFLTGKQDKELKFIPHKIENLILNKKDLDILKKADWVVSTIPCYWYYYYIRKKHNLKFNIIHSPKTALFARNWFNEQLCYPMLRKEDKILFISQYQKELYRKIFPEYLNEDNSFFCYPAFQRFFPKTKKKEPSKKPTFGFVGRISENKNFSQTLDTLIDLKRKGLGYKLVVCALIRNQNKKNNIIKTLEKISLNEEDLILRFNLKYEELWSYLRLLDVLLVTSTCGEPLGKTVVEASHLGIPTIAGEIGANPEIIPKENLVPVNFYKGKFNANKLQSIGKLDINSLVEKCISFKKLKTKENNYSTHDKIFTNLLKGRKIKERYEISDNVKEFIERLSFQLDDRVYKNYSDIIKHLNNIISKNFVKNKAVLLYFPKDKMEYYFQIK